MLRCCGYNRCSLLNDMYITNVARERNKEISENILQGEPVANIARIHGISHDRCVQILRSYCLRKERDIYLSITGRFSRPPGVNQLRKYVDAFISDDNDDDFFTDISPIWRIKEFPTRIVHALECENIRTVGELINLEVVMLKRIPMIGSVSIEIIEHFKDQYKQQNMYYSENINAANN